MVSALLPSATLPFPVRLRRSPTPPSPRRATISAAASSGDFRGDVAMDFPYLSPAHRHLMLDLLSATETTLGGHLLPSSVPADVLSFRNDSGSSQGALDIRLGDSRSMVNFLLKSWIHCDLPMGVLDIASLFIFLGQSTDAPHLLIEFIQNGPNSLVLIVDLLPRRDLVLHADYLDHFYQQSPLEKLRRSVESAAEVKPYLSSSLYIRSALSPTAIAVAVDSSSPEARDLEELVGGEIGGAAREAVGVWLERCALAEREVAAGDRPGLAARDDLMKKKTVEIDLAANLPRLFGPEVAGRVVAEIQKAFGIEKSHLSSSP